MPSTARILLVAALLTLVCAPAIAQAPPVAGTEMWFVPDYNQMVAGNCQFDNVVFRDAAGTLYTMTFNLAPSIGNGTYGPQFPEGTDYICEYVWLQDVAPGFVIGHTHNTTDATGTNIYEQSHANGTAGTATPVNAQLQGFRVTRVDGAAFDLVSFDYAVTQVPILVGTGPYTGYSDIFNWQSVGTAEGLILNDPNFNTIIFGSDETAALNVAPGAQMTFGTGTFNIQGTITGYRTLTGFNVNTVGSDDIIGATFDISGTFSGSDQTFLSGAALSPATMTFIATPGTDELLQSTSLAHNPALTPDYYTLAGGWGAEPTLVRAITTLSTGIGASIRTGTGSGVLDFIDQNFSTRNISLVFELRGGTPTLSSIEYDYVPNTTVPEARLGTSGNGDLVVGLAGFAPMARVYNLFDINPGHAAAAGPFFGLGFGPFQLQQIALPMGAQPFHVQASTEGSYFFGALPGTIPTGMVLDHTAVELTPAGTVGYISPVQRLTF